MTEPRHEQDPDLDDDSAPAEGAKLPGYSQPLVEAQSALDEDVEKADDLANDEDA